MSVQFSQRFEVSIRSGQLPSEDGGHPFSLQEAGAGVQTFAQRTAHSASTIAPSDPRNLLPGLGVSGELSGLIKRLMRGAEQFQQFSLANRLPGGFSQGG